MTRGKTLEGNTLILRFHQGSATDEDSGVTYDLTSSPAGSPIIRSSKTGRFFVLSWQELLEMAQEAGIDASEDNDARL